MAGAPNMPNRSVTNWYRVYIGEKAVTWTLTNQCVFYAQVIYRGVNTPERVSKWCSMSVVQPGGGEK